MFHRIYLEFWLSSAVYSLWCSNTGVWCLAYWRWPLPSGVRIKKPRIRPVMPMHWVLLVLSHCWFSDGSQLSLWVQTQCQWPPTLRPSLSQLTWAVHPSECCYCPHSLLPFVIVTEPISWQSFHRPVKHINCPWLESHRHGCHDNCPFTSLSATWQLSVVGVTSLMWYLCVVTAVQSMVGVTSV